SINTNAKSLGQSLNLGTKIQVSDLFFTIGESSTNFQNVGEFGNNGYGGEGYYKNNYREMHITKAYNQMPTMDINIFGFKSKEDVNIAKHHIKFTYTPAYGGNTKYNMLCAIGSGEGHDLQRNGDGKSEQFPSNKWGQLIADFGGIDFGINTCISVHKKHNGIYTFKTTYKGKTYTSILHLKLSE
ncbi:hypothetical protein L8U98_08165, partial [Campylobacter sp. RKI_CA19_01128]